MSDVVMEAPTTFMIYGSMGVLAMPRGAEFSGEITMFRMGNFEPTKEQYLFSLMTRKVRWC